LEAKYGDILLFEKRSSGLGLDAVGWCDLVQKFGKLFKRAAGATESLAAEAARRGQTYLQAPGASLLTVGSG
jgi:hypothetical protein